MYQDRVAEAERNALQFVLDNILLVHKADTSDEALLLIVTPGGVRRKRTYPGLWADIPSG